MGISTKQCYGGTSYVAACSSSSCTAYGKTLRMNIITDTISESRLRSLLARFGPVNAFMSDLNQFYLFYGWYRNPSDQLTTYRYLQRGGSGSSLSLSTLYQSPFPKIGQAIFFTEPPTDCTSSSIPQFGCKCTSTNNPTGCFCPTTPEELLNIQKSQCSCIADDQRPSCQTCTGAASDATDCTCPTTYAGVTGNLPSRCPCVQGDQRPSCSVQKCTSSQKPPQGCICSGSYQPTGCTCPQVGVDTQGLSTSTCPCIMNDVRSQCEPTKCTSLDLPPQSCLCTGDFNPDGCFCPDDVRDMQYFSLLECGCIPGDLREECKGDEPYNECKNITVSTSVTLCPCLKTGDPRSACKEAGKDASGQTRVVLSVIAAAVVLPMLALFC
ncbi:MAG: hypothetical protein EZS28_033224 [Streblomastix strix]|uniref:Uncharacterized protein n=1 Tax=Streblomastix strix TaxID=222440 RepID=A0A5J4UL56_9EUKA|nr:MAG: hypothetical protein EZS28_033224 [Streblomastix strix]